MPSKIITYSTLFPSATRPSHGIFVAELVKSLAAIMKVSVIAPTYFQTIMKERLNWIQRDCLPGGIEVRRPLCINIPKILKFSDSYLMAAGSALTFLRQAGADTDLVHAHFAYPDGVAAEMLASLCTLPVVVTVHGSDINILARHPQRQRQITRLFNRAEGIVCVSKALASKVRQLGASPWKIHHIPNGVDTSRFYPGEKETARKALGLDHGRKFLLTVGSLIPIKGYENLIHAIADLETDVSLVLVGEGPEEEKLKKLVKQLNIEARVHFAGFINHTGLRRYYQAADLLVISSYSEGWPTIIFEALACGLPIVANSVGGIPEILSSTEFGLLMENNSPETMRKSLALALNRDWDRQAAIALARNHSWAEIARRYAELFDHILKGSQSIPLPFTCRDCANTR